MKTLGLDIGTNSIGWAIVRGHWVELPDRKQPFFAQDTSNDNTDTTVSNEGSGTVADCIIDAGVVTFPISIEPKEQTKTLANSRREHRASRRHYDRRRRRKINTLRALIAAEMCPPLSEDELRDWKYKKKFPANKDFADWLQKNINPYELRYRAAHEKLMPHEYHALGRVFYHLAQRRGFLSNRKSDKQDPEDSKVYESISKLDDEIKESGEPTLGALFANKYNTYISLSEEDKEGENKGQRLVRHYRIRNQYTDRIKHYHSEFSEICTRQGMAEQVRKQLYKAIYDQRPLKSQKLTVGKCTLEPKRPRCPMSNPVFERFRMRQLINNIKITLKGESERALNAEEIACIEPLFFQAGDKSLEDLRKRIGTKHELGKEVLKDGEKLGKAVQTNYDRKARDAKLKSCTTLVGLMRVFLPGKGDKTLAALYEKLEECAKVKQRNNDDRVQELWHALYYADLQTRKSKEEIATYLKGWIQKHYDIDDEQAESFAGISLKGNYAKLSFRAMRSILSFLDMGIGYSHSVFFAKLPEIFSEVWESKKGEIQSEIVRVVDGYRVYSVKIDIINDFIARLREGEIPAISEFIDAALAERKLDASQLEVFDLEYKAWLREVCAMNSTAFQKGGRPRFCQKDTLESRVEEKITTLRQRYGSSVKVKTESYHPSKIDFSTISDPHPGRHTVEFPLPDPKTIRNPVYLRVVHQARKLLITLLMQNKIDKDTRIHVEVARDVNTLSAKSAIMIWQKRNQAKREGARQAIREFLQREATEAEIKKYILWKEQEEHCVYTGNKIGLSEFLGENPAYDIEHTIPQSLYYDGSMANLTLCDSKCNREVKKNRLPSELIDLPRSDCNNFMQRVKKWEKERKKAQDAKGKKVSDGNKNGIINKHIAQLEFNYWDAKCKSFTITRKELEERKRKFAAYKLPTTRMITSHITRYLRTVFDYVYTVEGQVTSKLRKSWLNVTKEVDDALGYPIKDRKFHYHHATDAILVALCQRNLYNILMTHWNKTEIRSDSGQDTIPFAPWQSFPKDVKQLTERIIPYLQVPNNYFKQTKKKLRTPSGKIAKNKKGETIYQKGRGVRVALNDENPLKLLKVTDSSIQLRTQLYYNKDKEDTKYVWAKTGTGSNYLALIYKDSAGSRLLEVVRAIDTLRGEKYSQAIEKKGQVYRLHQRLHPKQRVLFYCGEVQEIKDLISEQRYDILQDRLFDVIRFRTDQKIELRKSICTTAGNTPSSVLFDENKKMFNSLLISSKNWDFICEHQDFKVSRTGEITLCKGKTY